MHFNQLPRGWRCEWERNQVAEEIRPEQVSVGVRRLLQEATQLSQALDLIVTSQGSGSSAVAPLVRELTQSHRVLSTAFEESTGSALLPQTPPHAPKSESETVATEIGNMENRLQKTEARLSALRTPIAQLLRRLERQEATSRQSAGEAAPENLQSRNTELVASDVKYLSAFLMLAAPQRASGSNVKRRCPVPESVQSHHVLVNAHKRAHDLRTR